MVPPKVGVPLAIVASLVLVSLLAWASPNTKRALLLRPHEVRTRGQIHRLLTAGWIHADLSHLLVNAVTLVVFGDAAVEVLGPVVFGALYGSAVVMAFLPTTVLHARDRDYATLGASGAIAAVMLSAVLTHPEMKLQLLILPIPMPAVVYAVLYLAFSAWQAHAGAKDGVNHEAHFFGAVYGAIFTWIFEPARVERTVRALGAMAARWLGR